MLNTGRAYRFVYRNWRGSLDARRAYFTHLAFGSTEWHPEPQWLVWGTDLDKNEPRAYALADIEPGTLEELAAETQANTTDAGR